MNSLKSQLKKFENIRDLKINNIKVDEYTIFENYVIFQIETEDGKRYPKIYFENVELKSKNGDVEVWGNIEKGFFKLGKGLFKRKEDINITITF